MITYNGNVYQIQNSYTCKPYIYWDVNSPYELITSNTKLKETQGRYYILFNEKGIFTQVPQTDIEISFSENSSRDLITEKIVGFQNQFEENEIKFTTIETNVDGIKQTVGNVQEDVNGAKQTISEINQKTDNISASVSTLEREYAFNQELSALKENTNIALLGLQSTLGIFSSDMNNFMEDNKLSDEESKQINAYKDIMNTKLDGLNTQIDKTIALLESQEKTEDVTRLTTQKQLLNDSINNLLTNITTVCTDKVFTNTEITTVVSYFANANTKINETNNMIDELIFLETGGALVEEISKLNISQNEIKLSVSKTEQTTTEIEQKLESTVANVQVQYYLSTSTSELIGGTWTDVAPTWEEDKYMWSKTITTLTDGTIRESSPTCIAGAKGQDGVPGVDGVDGQTTYTWIKYADDENGNGISNNPTNKSYIGFAYNKTTNIESNSPSDYTWSLIKGADGADGKDGLNGTTYYTWIKYSDDADGSNMYDIPTDSTKYIGIATNKTTKTESTNPTEYTWSKFRGEDGADGVPGKDGVTTYTWIKYADDSNGNGISNDPTGKEYIGFAYNKTTSIESNVPSDYTWSLIKGADGVDGKDGEDGKDGTSVTILGSYNSVDELNQAHPNNNNNGDGYIVNGDLYIWDGNSFVNVGKIKGEDGQDGVDGQDGKNGLNAYVHIKYSNDGGKTFTPSNGEEAGDYLGIYTDYYEADSTDVARYTWSKIKGQDGVPGTNGRDGVTTYTWIKYSDNADGTGLYDTPNSQTKYIGIATNKTTSTESTNKTDYVWSLFRGEDGATGTGIESIVTEYYLSTSDTTQEGSSWTTTPPTWIKGTYIWTRNKITYKDPISIEYTDPVLDSTWGAMSDIQDKIDNTTIELQKTKETVAEHTTNLDSITSRVSSTEKDITTIQNKVNIAIKEVYTMYYLSTSSTQLIDGVWSRDVPSDISYNYLWTKTVTVYIDDTTSESDPICNTGMNGEDGEPGYTVILSDETFIVQCDLSGNPL